MDDDKRTFLLFALFRLSGLAVFFVGVWTGFGDGVRQGGMPELGLPVAIAGMIGAVLAPRLVKRFR